MKIITHEVEGVWQRFYGTAHLDAVKIARLVADGTWNDDDLSQVGLRAAEPFQVPDGKIIDGPESFEEVDGQLVQVFPVADLPPQRRLIRKSLVQQRLIDAGLIDHAFNALMLSPTAFARWFAPDHPEVYADDPDALALLQGIGADPDVILAAEGGE